MAKYRLFLALFLLSKVHGALRRGTSELTSSHLETVNVEAPQATRRLETSYFKPLSCNDNMAPCVPWTSMYGAGMTKHVRLVIPCGICVYMDLPGDTLTLEDGMDVRGRLEIRNDYKITIVSPMIVVQGSLLVWSSWKVRGTPRVKFILDGRANQYFTPIDENRNVCEGRDCEVGPRSFTVAGGKVNFRGIYIKVPTFTKLFDVDGSNAIVLPDPDGLMSHWRKGTEIVIATTSHMHDFHQVRTITRSDPWTEQGFIRFELDKDIYHETTAVESEDFAAEVALLSRNIVMESPPGSGGGHFWVMQTPHVNQEIRGVEFRNFGQAGLLGRYPLHFHMCGDSRGSVIVKNTIRNSNQRGLVVHATDNLKITDNVSFDVMGHSYVIEDGIETGNQFIHNIAIYTRNQDRHRLIPPDRHALNGDETDDQSSAFWITSANNDFIDNIAAGAQTSGFWFELMKRGPMADDYPNMEPKKVSMGVFEGNIAHSVTATAIRFYLNGYEPESLQTIKGLKVYRCNFGMRLHRVHSLHFVDSLFADNGNSMLIDLSANIRFTNARIIGYSRAYERYIERNFFGRDPCPRRERTRIHEGIRFARDSGWNGSPLNGMYLTNVRFQRFENLPCETAAFKLHDTPNNYETFDMGSRLRHVSVDSDLIDFCPGTRRGFTDVYLSDETGSFAGNGLPSSIFVNSLEMSKFVDSSKCATNNAKCHTTCRNTCFRSVFYTIPASDSGRWRLKVCDRNNLSFCQLYEEHMKHPILRRRFAVHVPSGRKYDVVFVNRRTGLEEYPENVNIEFQDKMCSTAPDEEDINFLELPRGHTHSPTASPTTFDYRCENTVRNSDMESGTRHWSVVGLGGMTTTSGYRSPTALNYLGAGRGQAHTARIQTSLDLGPCFQLGSTWEFKARLKLVNSTTGRPVACSDRVGEITCPKILLTLRDFDSNLFYHKMSGFSQYYRWSPFHFNLFRGRWTVGEEVRGTDSPRWNGRARIARVGFLDFPRGLDLAIDDFEVEQVYSNRRLSEAVTLPMPTLEAGSCYGDIVNADLDQGHEGFWSTVGKGDITRAAGPSGKGIRYNGLARVAHWEGPSYDLSILASDDCIGQGSTWEVTAQLNLVDSKTRTGFACYPASDTLGLSCPKLELTLGDMRMDIYQQKIDGILEWDADGYNLFKAHFKVPTENDDWTNLASRAEARFIDFPLGTDLTIDGFHMKRID